MPRTSSQPQTRHDHESLKVVPTAAQSAGYTYDMLICLRKLAVDYKQTELARLIQAAAREACFQAGRDCGQF